MILTRGSFQRSTKNPMTCRLLAVSLFLAWPVLQTSAQQQEGTPLRVPPGTDLRATLGGKTETVRVQVALSPFLSLLEGKTPTKVLEEGTSSVLTPDGTETVVSSTRYVYDDGTEWIVSKDRDGNLTEAVVMPDGSIRVAAFDPSVPI